MSQGCCRHVCLSLNVHEHAWLCACVCVCVRFDTGRAKDFKKEQGSEASKGSDRSTNRELQSTQSLEQMGVSRWEQQSCDPAIQETPLRHSQTCSFCAPVSQNKNPADRSLWAILTAALCWPPSPPFQTLHSLPSATSQWRRRTSCPGWMAGMTAAPQGVRPSLRHFHHQPVCFSQL